MMNLPALWFLFDAKLHSLTLFHSAWIIKHALSSFSGKVFKWGFLLLLKRCWGFYFSSVSRSLDFFAGCIFGLKMSALSLSLSRSLSFFSLSLSLSLSVSIEERSVARLLFDSNFSSFSHDRRRSSQVFLCSSQALAVSLWNISFCFKHRSTWI